MKKLQLPILVLFSLFLSLPALAQQVHFETVDTSGQFKIKFSSTAPLSGQLHDNDQFIQMSLSPANLAKEIEKPIDKGLLKSWTATQSGGKTLVKVRFISKPKASLVWSADKTSGSLILWKNQLAEKNPFAKIDTTPSKPSQAIQPKPSPPATEVKEKPAPVEPATTPATTPAPSSSIVAQFRNAPLKQALTEIAQKTGRTARFSGDGFDALVTRNISTSSIEKAITDLLGEESPLYAVAISPTMISIQYLGDSSQETTSTLEPPSSPTQAPTPEKAATQSLGINKAIISIKDKTASEMLEAARLAVPELKIVADDLANLLIVEGEASEIQKLRDMLQSVSVP